MSGKIAGHSGHHALLQFPCRGVHVPQRLGFGEIETNSVPLVSKLFYLRPNGIENVTVTNIKRKILFYGIFYTYF